MSQGPVRIAIVNDYEIVVAGIAAVLLPYADRIEVVELDARMPVVSPVDVLLYDSFGQAQGDAVDVAELLAGSNARLVIFSWNTDPELVQRTLRAGASGYLSKGVSADELVSSLEAVRDGEMVVPDGTPAPPDFGRWPGDEHGLTAREAEVLALICQGLSNEEIGQRAFIGINTVKTYIRTLYRKIEVVSRTQAVIWGHQHGFEPDRSRTIVDNHP